MTDCNSPKPFKYSLIHRRYLLVHYERTLSYNPRPPIALLGTLSLLPQFTSIFPLVLAQESKLALVKLLDGRNRECSWVPNNDDPESTYHIRCRWWPVKQIVNYVYSFKAWPFRRGAISRPLGGWLFFWAGVFKLFYFWEWKNVFNLAKRKNHPPNGSKNFF